MVIRSMTEETTLQIGRCIGEHLTEGNTVLLRGEMGAGKSVFSRGVARGLGVEGPVPSPTFTLLNIHEGTAKKLYHFDLYRLDSTDALYEMGLNEYIGADGVTLIEWPEKAEEAMPERCLEVTLRYTGENGLSREVTLLPCGGFDFAPVEQALREAGF